MTQNTGKERMENGLSINEDSRLGPDLSEPYNGCHRNNATEKVESPTRLEGFKSCSKSLLWELMLSFYKQKGIDSWAKGIVPFFITCNAFIARSYAKVLQGFIADLKRSKGRMLSKMRLREDKKLYIIEVGAGSGKFSFLMLKALQKIKPYLEFPVENIVYVMTDAVDSNVNFWMNHKPLMQFVETGQLDFATLDANNDNHITLRRSGVILSPEHPTDNPIIVIANYLFDTLCHDIFQVHSGQLHEGLISVGSKRGHEENLCDPEIINYLKNEFTYVSSDVDHYKTSEDKIDNLHLSRILAWYKEKFTKDDPFENGASFLMPIGALRSLRKMAHISSGRVLVISGDKGHNKPESFRGLTSPQIVTHGSFSVMVNYHALGAYFISRGGFALHSSQEESSLAVSCFVLPGYNEVDNGADFCCFADSNLAKMNEERKIKFPLICQAFEEHVEHFGPNDFFVTQKSLMDENVKPNLRSIISLLRLADWDPDVFWKFRQNILNQITDCPGRRRKDLCDGLLEVWDKYYHMIEIDKDIAFEIGRVYYGFGEYEHAMKFYDISCRTIGVHHITYHNIGLCYYSLGKLEQAADFFSNSLKLDSSYAKASSWLNKVLHEIREIRS